MFHDIVVDLEDYLTLETKYNATIEAIANGCIILPTSCQCGGSYAWLIPKSSGAYETYGCICHNKPPKIKKEINHAR